MKIDFLYLEVIVDCKRLEMFSLKGKMRINTNVCFNTKEVRMWMWGVINLVKIKKKYLESIY